MASHKSDAARPKSGKTVEEKRQAFRKALNLCAALALLAVFCGGFAVERFGGRGSVPTWNDLNALLGLQSELTQAAPEGVRVILLDVGQGDAALIEQGGEYCLIDAGSAESEDALLRQLRQAGVRELALLVMTHPHADHIGGMQAVLEEFPVELMLLPDLGMTEFSSATLDRLLEQVKALEVPTAQAETGDSYPIGAGTLTVLLAGWAAEEGRGDDPVNNTSLCLRYEYGDFSFVDTGDAEQGAEEALVAGGAPQRCTVFMAGHHGSDTSNTMLLLEQLRPQAVGISCGADNEYGHPHKGALERFAQIGAKVYRTDLEGAIVFEMTDGALYVTGAGGRPLAPAA